MPVFLWFWRKKFPLNFEAITPRRLNRFCKGMQSINLCCMFDLIIDKTFPFNCLIALFNLISSGHENFGHRLNSSGKAQMLSPIKINIALSYLSFQNLVWICVSYSSIEKHRWINFTYWYMDFVFSDKMSQNRTQTR